MKQYKPSLKTALNSSLEFIWDAVSISKVPLSEVCNLKSDLRCKLKEIELIINEYYKKENEQ